MADMTQQTFNALVHGLGNMAAAKELQTMFNILDVISGTEIGYLDGVTAGTATASKALVVDANKDIATIRDLTGRNLNAGTAGATQGTVTLSGATSGTVTLAVGAAAGTWTFTLPGDDGDAGEQLQTNGSGVSSWEAAGSLRAVKNVIAEVSDKAEEVLERLLGVGVYEFTYKEDGRPTTGDFKTHYVGVMAEELPEVMHHNGRIFSPVSAFGELLLAIKALAAKVNKLEMAQC